MPRAPLAGQAADPTGKQWLILSLGAKPSGRASEERAASEAARCAVKRGGGQGAPRTESSLLFVRRLGQPATANHVANDGL